MCRSVTSYTTRAAAVSSEMRLSGGFQQPERHKGNKYKKELQTKTDASKEVQLQHSW